MLEEKLATMMGWVTAKVSSVGRLDAKQHSPRQVRHTRSMNIIGHEIVIISWEPRRQTDAAVVLPRFTVLWDAVFSSEVKRARYLIILGIPALNPAEDRNEFRLALNQG